MKATGVYLVACTAAAAAATALGALIFVLTCNENLYNTGLEGALCDIADGVAVASVVLSVAVPVTAGWMSRRGQVALRLFTASWLGFVGWGALLVAAAFLVD